MLNHRGDTHRTRYWLALLLLPMAGMASAQPTIPFFDMDRLQLDPSARDGLVVSAGDLLPEHGLRLAFTTDYQHRPLDLRSMDPPGGGLVVDGRLTVHLLAAYGVSRRFEAGLDMPFVASQFSQPSVDNLVAPVQPLALGAPRLQGRFRLIPERDDQLLDLTLTLGATLPLGLAEALTLDPWPNSAFTFRITAGRTEGFVRYGVELGAVARGKMEMSHDEMITGDEIGSYLEGGMVFSTTGEGLRGEVSVRGAFPLSRSVPASEVLAGLRYPFGKLGFEAFALAGAGFGELPGTPRFRGLLGIAWRHMP